MIPVLERQKLATLNSNRNSNLNPLIANPIKWPKTLKQFVGNLPTNCLSVFGHFVNLALKGLIKSLFVIENM